LKLKQVPGDTYPRYATGCIVPRWMEVHMLNFSVIKPKMTSASQQTNTISQPCMVAVLSIFRLAQWFSNWGPHDNFPGTAMYHHDAPEEKNLCKIKFSSNSSFQAKLNTICSYGSLILLRNQTVTLAKVGIT